MKLSVLKIILSNGNMIIYLHTYVLSCLLLSCPLGPTRTLISFMTDDHFSLPFSFLPTLNYCELLQIILSIFHPSQSEPCHYINLLACLEKTFLSNPCLIHSYHMPQVIDGTVVLKWILTNRGGKLGTEFIWLVVQWSAPVTVMT
jgi:hypothetical protein